MATAKTGKSANTTTLKTAQLVKELTESDVTDEERVQMIEEAAYYRAKERGFQGDEHLRDWLEAEALVDDMLKRVVTGQDEKGHK